MRTTFPITALIIALSFQASRAHAAGERPNFIVILADDQGWGTTSVMMDPLVPGIHTPV